MAMSLLTPEPMSLLTLELLTQADRSDRLYNVCSSDLLANCRWGHAAVSRALEAWVQLEQLGADVMSMGSSFDFCDGDKSDKALKDVKLLLRDRVVWQTMGLFHTMTDTQVMMDYLKFKLECTVPRRRVNDLMSQLKNAI